MTRKEGFRFGFDLWGLGLFLLIMLPNILWFSVPAPRDILRAESHTPGWDLAASCFQVLLAVSLCAFKNSSAEAPFSRKKSFWLAAVFCGCYFFSWVLYYSGNTSPALILSLCLFPCAAFFTFAWNRKNLFAMVFSVLFTLCHLAGAVVNFLLW